MSLIPYDHFTHVVFTIFLRLPQFVGDLTVNQQCYLMNVSEEKEEVKVESID